MPLAKKLTPFQKKRITELSGLGFDASEISCLLQIPQRVLDTISVTEDRKRARLKMKEKLLKKQYQMALAGDRTMNVWLGKVALGMNENILVTDNSKVLVKWGE